MSDEEWDDMDEETEYEDATITHTCPLCGRQVWIAKNGNFYDFYCVCGWAWEV